MGQDKSSKTPLEPGGTASESASFRPSEPSGPGLTPEVGAKGGIFEEMLGEDAIGSGVSTNRTEEQRTASAPPLRKTIMSEEITGE